MTSFYLNIRSIIRQIRVRISGSHFAKCKRILSFCEVLSQRNNKYTKLSILLLAPKFHVATTIFKQDNLLQKHLISWHNLILQPTCQANFRVVYLTSFMFHALNVLYFSLFLFCVTVKQLSSAQARNEFFKSIFINVK